MAALQPEPEDTPAKAFILGGMCMVAGFIMLAMSGSWWLDYRSMQAWQPVAAEVLELELVTRDSQDGGTRQYIRCVYRYEWDGKAHTSSRVAIDPSPTGDRYRVLRRSTDRSQPFTAYVNPDAPDQATLFRDASQASYTVPVVGMLFSGIGLHVFIHGLRQRKRAA